VLRHDFAHPAAALLIESGQRSLGVQPDRSLEVAAGDWSALPDAAERHGMTAWVHLAVRSREDAPAPVRAALEVRARAQHVRALHAVSHLSALVRSLRGAGVRVVSLKGPLFSTWLYGDLGMRRFADLDLLIDPHLRARAYETLVQAGYSLRRGMSMATARAVYAGTGAWPLGHASGLPIDLHWRTQALGFASPLRPREVLDDSITTPAAGGDMKIPCPTHAAALALLHAAKHLWSSLELVLSIAHLTRRVDVDWSRVYHLASRAGAWQACAAGLALARELFDAETPAPIRARVEAAGAAPLVHMALSFLAMPDVAGAPLRAEFTAHCASLDSLPGRARYAAWRLLAPTPLDSAWWPLPDRLTAFYAPVRLIRLAVRRRADGK
jgi:hypothetical protein